MRKSFDDQGAQFAWDATSLNAWLTCPQYYKYTILDGWRSKGESVHLWFGGHIATALENFYKYRAQGMDYETTLRQVVRDTLQATWHNGAPDTFDDQRKTRENLIRSIIWYAEHFKDEHIEVVHLADGTPAVELSFSLDFGNNLLWCGHIDRVVNYSGDTYIMDQKTTGSTINNKFFKQFHLSTQMSGYTFAGKALYHIPVKGVIIDGIQIAVGFTSFERGFTFRTDAQLQEWYDEAHLHIANARAATLANQFPKNTTACDKFGGCAFRDICSRSPESRLNYLHGDFEIKNLWDPLERR